jgi:tRNA (guanine6-N2)-methyltransferase
VTVKHGSAVDLPLIADGSINKVITDPPWGMYGDLKEPDLRYLYKQSLNEMARVLKPGGIAVILSGNSELNEIANEARSLEIVKTYSILVSGKKATILKMRRRA